MTDQRRDETEMLQFSLVTLIEKTAERWDASDGATPFPEVLTAALIRFIEAREHLHAMNAEASLIDAIEEALRVFVGVMLREGASLHAIAIQVAQRLESKVIWRDDVEQVGWCWLGEDGAHHIRCSCVGGEHGHVDGEPVYRVRAGSGEQ